MGTTLGAHLSLSPDHFVALYSIIFVLCGDGAERENLMNQAHSLKNIKFMPLQPIEKFNELLNMANVHLLPQREDAASLVMPSKLGGMLASGCPILATVGDTSCPDG